MLTSDKFFESFDQAGFLKSASWTPSFGGDPFTDVKVRLRMPDVAILEGFVVASEPEIDYVTAQLPGLREAEQLVVDGVLYAVRKAPTRRLDGSVSRAELKKV